MCELTIRLARAADAGALGALWSELDRLHSELHPGFFRMAARPAAYLRGLLAAPNELVFVAEQAGELCGCLTARLYDTPEQPLFRPRRRVQLDDLVVLPSARRRGIGRRLMAAAETWARENGAEQLVLTVWQGNDEAAAFYAQTGYAEAHRVLVRELDA